MKSFLLIFIGQFLVYFLVVVNTRAYTNDNYALTAISDLIFASVNFFIIKRIAKETSNMLDLTAYVLGGTVGSLLSMYISKEYLLV